MAQTGINPRQQKLISALFAELDLPVSKICVKVGVPSRTYYNWLKDPNFTFALDQARNEFIKAHLKDVDCALLRQAKRGNVSAIKLIYERFDMLIASPGESSDEIDESDLARRMEKYNRVIEKMATEYSEYSDDELKERAEEIVEEVQVIVDGERDG